MLLLSAAAPVPSGAAFAKKKASPPAAASASLGREATGVLASKAADGDAEVRALTAAAWGALGNRAAVPILKKALADDNPDVRANAAASLLKLGDVQGLVALIDETKTFKSGPSSSPADELRRMARDAARARAVIKLGEGGGEKALDTLRALLGDGSGEVRDAAAVALARLGQGSAAHFLEAMKDPDEAVRSSAAHMLGLIGKDGLEPLKKAAASDASASVRAEACAALGAFSDPPSAAVLAAALSDKSGRTRLSAERALARRSEAASTAALKGLLDRAPQPEPALIALAALAERGVETDLSLPELTLGQKDAELRLLAVDALAASPRPEAPELLARAMRADADGRVRVKAAQALIARLRKAGANL